MRSMARKRYTWRARGFRLELGVRTRVMGIVNVTLDSFSGDGVLAGCRKEKIPGLRRALELVDEGADILDIGGASSRPGAAVLAAEEESRRVVPLIAALARRIKIPVSVDTCHAVVALRALDAGAAVINLIKGTAADPRLLALAGRSGAGLILMHMRGTPRTMQQQTRYRDVVLDVGAELKEALEHCLACGIKKSALVVDPGFGFAKTAGQNLELLKRLNELAVLGFPVLVGTSRKSFIGKVLGVEARERLMGTAATVVLAAVSGAHIVRVHDVQAMKQAVLMADAVGAAQ